MKTPPPLPPFTVDEAILYLEGLSDFIPVKLWLMDKISRIDQRLALNPSEDSPASTIARTYKRLSKDKQGLLDRAFVEMLSYWQTNTVMWGEKSIRLLLILVLTLRIPNAKENLINFVTGGHFGKVSENLHIAIFRTIEVLSDRQDKLFWETAIKSPRFEKNADLKLMAKQFLERHK